MNIPLWLRRTGVVLTTTILGTALGYGFTRFAGQALAQQLPVATASATHDLGDMVVLFMKVGYNLGLVTGVLMTAAVLGGLVAGLALSRRVNVSQLSVEHA